MTRQFGRLALVGRPILSTIWSLEIRLDLKDIQNRIMSQSSMVMHIINTNPRLLVSTLKCKVAKSNIKIFG